MGCSAGVAHAPRPGPGREDLLDELDLPGTLRRRRGTGSGSPLFLETPSHSATCGPVVKAILRRPCGIGGPLSGGGVRRWRAGTSSAAGASSGGSRALGRSIATSGLYDSGASSGKSGLAAAAWRSVAAEGPGQLEVEVGDVDIADPLEARSRRARRRSEASGRSPPEPSSGLDGRDRFLGGRAGRPPPSPSTIVGPTRLRGDGDRVGEPRAAHGPRRHRHRRPRERQPEAARIRQGPPHGVHQHGPRFAPARRPRGAAWRKTGQGQPISRRKSQCASSSLAGR